jgi:hypothetical protein
MTDSADASATLETKGECRPGISFFELRDGRCRFPLGTINDPPERFCGEPAPIGSVYCERCQAKAYNRAAGRR